LNTIVNLNLKTSSNILHKFSNVPYIEPRPKILYIIFIL